MSKDARKALMIAKGQVSSGYLPPGDPQREANLARHMEGSAAPPVMYHGTTRIKSWRSDPGPIDKFQGDRGHPDAPVAAYAAFDPEFAARFANYDPMEKPKNTLKEQGHVYPLHVRATNIFDIANPKHRELVSLTRHPAKAEERHYKNLPDDKYPWDWHDLEHNTHKIKKAGFDSFYDYETNALSKAPPSGIGVFDPAQIKSATGNNGQYDPNEPEIDKAEGGEVDNQPENDLLQPIGKSKTAGAEKPLFDDGIYKAAVAETPWSNRKSIRYIHHDDEGNPIGAMQIMTHGPKTKTATIQNVYVAEKYRRQKIASGLLARARQDFDVRHSKDLTLQGKNFAKAVKNTGGYVHKAEGGAVEETVPEAPHTLESQLQAFLQGKRKAVLYTHEEPALPEGASRVETQHGVFHYNPALIDERSIKAAVAGDRINEILGYGPYSKKDILNRVSAGDTPLAVVGRDAEGREVVAAAGTHGTANEQASAIAAQLPTGGQVHIESPQQVISERIAALRSPEQGNKDARKALMVAKARGGSIEDEAIKAALKQVASPFSRSPEMRQHARRFVDTLKVPQGGETGSGSYYNIKQPVDVRDVTATVGAIPGVNPLQPKKMSWEDFHKIGKGGTLINIGGDRSNLGQLTHIQGKKLAWPVDLHAGPGYMLEPNPGQVWSNNKSAASDLFNKIQIAAEKGPVFGAYSPMGGQAVDSSHNMFNALMAQVPGSDISKKAAKEFDQALRTGQHVTGIGKADLAKKANAAKYLKSWPGILNAEESSEFAKTLPGTHRSAIVKFMDKSNWRDEGFPNVGMTRVSITDPEVLGAHGNMLGHRIVKFSPDDFSEKNQTFTHSTYTNPTTGSYVGDVPLVQRQYAMPDVADAMLLKPAAGNRIVHPLALDALGRSTARKLYEDQKQLQPINQRMLDSVQQGLEKQPDYGFAAGGMVDDDPNRQLDQSGFYNAAAEAAQGIPQAKGTPQQMMSMVQKAPGTQETMKWSGADQAFAGQPIVSKDDLVNHFQTNAPKLEETQLGLRSRTIEYDVAVLRYRNAIKQGAPKEEQDRLGAIANSFIDSPEPKYKKYTIPGGENYREILLKAPPNKSPERDRMSEIENRRADIQKELMKLNDDELYRHLSTEGTANVEDFTKEKIRLLSETENLKNEYKSLVPKTQNIDYNSSHWEGHPNVVAHLRMSDRTLPQTNEKALHLEELQSDWGQAGREGFKKSPEELASMKDDMLAAHKNYLDLNNQWSGATEDQIQAAEDKYHAVMNEWGSASRATTPEGPYVGNTAKWTELGLKRALIEAARNGHDKLIWTPGEDQADRYDLSRQVSHIDYNKHGPDEYRLGIVDKDGSGVDLPKDVYKASELPSVVGKEVANKIINGEGQAGGNRMTLRGLDLKVGGEGMKGYYDKIVPTALARIVKSIGHTPEFGTDYIKGKTYDADLDVYKHAVTGKYHVATGDKRDHPDAEDMEAGPFNTHGEAVAHRDLLYKGLKAVPSLKITPAMRETISKGLPRKTGGFVPPARSSAVEQALKLTSKSGATLPAAVFLARQHQRRN